MHGDNLEQAYARLHAQATRLAGQWNDLSQRAAVYHHVFRDSGGNHAFPLIAAHGALWARGYFRFGMRLGRVLSLQYGFDQQRRLRQMLSLEAFANAFREINRRVCVDTYTNYYFVGRYGEHPCAARFLPEEHLEALNRVHAARRAGREMTSSEKRRVFETHFLHEQEFVVGPSILKAAAEFDWPVVKFIALRPLIRFAYFPRRTFLWFRNFADRAERVEKGLRAFDTADRAGWSHVESALRAYEVLPQEFFAGSVTYFDSLRGALLGGT
jgi:hypothetical protein